LRLGRGGFCNCCPAGVILRLGWGRGGGVEGGGVSNPNDEGHLWVLTLLELKRYLVRLLV
jgi:hypothetical protein